MELELNPNVFILVVHHPSTHPSWCVGGTGALWLLNFWISARVNQCTGCPFCPWDGLHFFIQPQSLKVFWFLIFEILFSRPSFSQS
jgi:hypothetical protein